MKNILVVKENQVNYVFKLYYWSRIVRWWEL